MNVGSIIVLIVMLIINTILEKRFPQFCKRIELPCIIIASILIAIYCSFLIYGVYDVLTSNVSRGDKVFFTIFIGCVVAVYVTILTLMWRKWIKERKCSK